MERGAIFNDNVAGDLNEAGGHVGISIQSEGGGGSAAEGSVLYAQSGIDRRQELSLAWMVRLPLLTRLP